MPGKSHQEPTKPTRPLALAFLASVLLLVLSLPALALSGAGGGHGASAEATRLAVALPGDADRLEQLREPVGTAQAQLSTALDQLGQMNALTFDPHYLPALVAVGRAYVAVSGQDPLTGTTIDPNYLGLDRELAGDAALVRQAADRASLLSVRVKRLERALIRARRR